MLVRVMQLNKRFFLEPQIIKKHYIPMKININTGSVQWAF